MSSDINIAILGKEGVGKSWLANRLVCGLSKDKKDYQYDEIKQEHNIFQEKQIVQTVPQNPEQIIQYQYKVGQFNIIETVGIGSLGKMSIEEQVKNIVQSLQKIDYFIFVQECDRQLQQEVLILFQFVSKECQPYKLLVFLNKDFTFLNNDQKTYKQPQWYNLHKSWQENLSLYCSHGLQTNALYMTQFLLDQTNQQKQHFYEKLGFHKNEEQTTQQFKGENKASSVFVFSKNGNLITQIQNEGFKVIKHDQLQDEADLVIVDYDFIKPGGFCSEKREEKLGRLMDDKGFVRKGILYFQSPDEFKKQMQNPQLVNFRSIQYMKERISVETMCQQIRNPEKIDPQEMRRIIQ